MLEKLQFHSEPVVVTGAGGGIGGACCVALAELGATVILVDNNSETLKASETNISKSASAKAYAYAIDVSDERQIDEVRMDVEARWGHIKALINCAGVNFESTVVDLSTDKWRHIIGVQLDAVFFMCRAFIPLLLKGTNGSVLNISSPFGIVGHPKSAAYSAAKGAVMALTRQMAADYGPRGLRVNSLCPGPTLSPRLRSYIQSGQFDTGALIDVVPLRRFAECDEIANAAAFLISDAASYIHGATVMSDGGLSIV
jgi:NAD(P)-dependent dehydrogenase (short-subunit alcohol dehydrogenase family)